MATFTYKGLLQRDDPIFKEPVSRFPARLGRKLPAPKMISLADPAEGQSDTQTPDTSQQGT